MSSANECSAFSQADPRSARMFRIRPSGLSGPEIEADSSPLRSRLSRQWALELRISSSAGVLHCRPLRAVLHGNDHRLVAAADPPVRRRVVLRDTAFNFACCPDLFGARQSAHRYRGPSMCPHGTLSRIQIGEIRSATAGPRLCDATLSTLLALDRIRDCGVQLKAFSNGDPAPATFLRTVVSILSLSLPCGCLAEIEYCRLRQEHQDQRSLRSDCRAGGNENSRERLSASDPGSVPELNFV